MPARKKQSKGNGVKEHTMDLEQRAKELIKAIKESGKGVQFKALGEVKLSARECAYMCKKVGLKFHDGLEKRVVNFRFTDTTKDRDGDVIMSKGVDLTQFKRDPVILPQHQGRELPIGRALSVKYDEESNSIIGKVLFFDDTIDLSGMSETYFRMVDSGALQGGSIGFDADWKNVRKPSPEEKKLYKMDDNGLIFDKITLIEFSIVTIPANLNARQIPSGKAWDDTAKVMKENGAISEDMIKRLRESETTKQISYSPDIKTKVFDDSLEILKKEAPNLFTAIDAEKPKFAEWFTKEILDKYIPMPKVNPPKKTTDEVIKDFMSDDNHLKDDTPIASTKIYINETDTPEQRQSKLDLAKNMKEMAFSVEVIVDEKQSAVTNVVGITDEQKAAVKETIEGFEKAVTSLKEKFQSLLDTAGYEKNESPESPKEADDGKEKDYYNILKNVTQKLKEKK
jgi:hypothetical protein